MTKLFQTFKWNKGAFWIRINQRKFLNTRAVDIEFLGTFYHHYYCHLCFQHVNFSTCESSDEIFRVYMDSYTIWLRSLVLCCQSSVLIIIIVVHPPLRIMIIVLWGIPCTILVPIMIGIVLLVEHLITPKIVPILTPV